LPAGRFSLTATKPGWVTSYYGARDPWAPPGVPVSLAAGERRSDLRIVMAPGAAIDGRVTDDRGRPETGVYVLALQVRRAGGEETLASVPGAHMGRTDDRGVYRIYGLPPGEFFVAAGTPSVGGVVSETTAEDVRWASDQAAGPAAAPRPPVTPAVGRLTAFYPTGADSETATPLDLAIGEDRPGIDVVRAFVRTSRVRGDVVLPDGTPAAGARVALAPLPYGRRALSMSDSAVGLIGPAGAATTVAAADGAFVIDGLLPGAYQLLVETPHTAATETVSVVGGDVGGLSIRLRPRVSLRGRVIFESHDVRPPANLQDVSLRLTGQSALGTWTAGDRADVHADGSFELLDLVPGGYQMEASAPAIAGSGTWFARSAIVKGRNILDASVEFEAGEDLHGVEIVFTDRAGEISGTLTDAAGHPVTDLTLLLFPSDPSGWKGDARTTRLTRPDAAGRYLLQALPAGEYYLAALLTPDKADVADPTFLGRVAAVAVKFQLGDGEHRTQDLQLR